MKKQSFFIVFMAVAVIVGLLSGRIFPASSEVAPHEPVQGKGQVITFVQDKLVPAGSSAATNVRSEPISVASYKKLSFLAAVHSSDGEILPEEIRQKVALGLVFFEGDEKDKHPFRAESNLELNHGFWGVDLGGPTAQIDVPAPYGRVEIGNDSDQDVLVTIKAYATQ